ncbi:MAG: beta-ketoacyl-[acyl-carrier-protein] synthase II [Anaerolineaceae bacterium 4572_78]|nr:MAG: beta-ketoacyl-[acyl-carrier-protein] synthase II [Anaerolineaceae bacterium 4572_78]
MNTQKRVVITGLGAVTPLGNDMDTTWHNLINGVCGIDTITAFDVSNLPTKIGGQVKDFNPTEYMSTKSARRMGRFIQLATSATYQAIADSRLDLSKEDSTRIGLEIGSALGGLTTIEEQSIRLHEKGYRRVNPSLVPSTLINMAVCFLAIDLNIQGPTKSSVLACATGIVSIGEAMRQIAWGDADVMLAGSTESAMTPLFFVGFYRVGALSRRMDTPHQSLMPFDINRDGTVIGEGASVLVLESLSHARARNAKILAEIVGYGLTHDAYNIAAPCPDGNGAVRAMQRALQSANLSPSKIDYISAHGTGTPHNDLAETIAIKTVFADYAYNVPISSTKGMTGHMMGTSGALACASVVKAMNTNIIPPTFGLSQPDPKCDLDYVPNKARQHAVQYGMVNAFGFGGQNASLILKLVEGK